MTTRRIILIVISAFECLLLAPLAMPAELPESARVLDPDILFYSWPYPKISPNGMWIAYVSKGFVCVCNVKEPAPHQVLEVPYTRTWPKFEVRTGEHASYGSFESLAKGLSHDEYQKLNAQVTNTIFGFVWTFDSAGVVFSVQIYNPATKTSVSDAYLATVDGKISTLSHYDSTTKTRGIVVGTLTRDRKFLVSPGLVPNQGIDRPLIWNVETNKPRATPFEYLTPSATSGRWLGIEKDSQQLVITDESFNVIKRFEEFRKFRSYGFKLDWSPDERFIIWRNQIGFDHYNNWEGFWLNVDTREKRELDGRFMDEQIAFTDRGGEFFRCGQDGLQARWSGDQITGAHLTIVPGDAKTPPKDVWRLTLDRSSQTPGALTNRPGNPPIEPGPKCNLFAIGLPRPAGKASGWIWHLIDRAGNKWQFPGNDNDEFLSPYQVVGFANGGDTIVAYNKKQLFAIPVKSIVTSDNQIP